MLKVIEIYYYVLGFSSGLRKDWQNNINNDNE